MWNWMLYIIRQYKSLCVCLYKTLTYLLYYLFIDVSNPITGETKSFAIGVSNRYCPRLVLTIGRFFIRKFSDTCFARPRLCTTTLSCTKYSYCPTGTRRQIHCPAELKTSGHIACRIHVSMPTMCTVFPSCVVVHQHKAKLWHIPQKLKVRHQFW